MGKIIVCAPDFVRNITHASTVEAPRFKLPHPYLLGTPSNLVLIVAASRTPVNGQFREVQGIRHQFRDCD
jgi:hypothetical protein